MSIRAIIESSFHVEHFRNIDLFNQGFYSLRVKMYHMEGLTKVYSFPLEISLSETAEKKREFNRDNNKSRELTDVTEGFLDDAEHSFFTRSFVIRYFDEEVEANDICTFRSEIEVKEGFLNTEFFVETDLFYIELKNMGTAKLADKVKQVIENFPLKSVSKASFKINKFGHGISEYFPLVFEGQFFWQFNCTFHSCLVDMRFRPFPVHMEESGGQYDAESEAKFFFKNEKGEIPNELNLKKVDKVYNEYINIYSHMYDRMTGKFKRYVSECLDAEQIELLEDRVNIPSLKLPGDELFKESLREEFKAKPGMHTENDMFIQPPTTPNDLLDDSDTEYAIETLDNLSEEKAVTKIPVLKNRQKNFMNKKIIPFSERNSHLSDPIKIAKKILEELCYVSLQLSDIWNRLLECIRIEPKFILEFLKVDYDQKIREKWCENVYRKIIMNQGFTCHTDDDFEEIHNKFIVDRVDNGYQSKIDQLIIQDLNLWSKLSLHPMLIEHWYQRQGCYSIDIESTMDDTDAEELYTGYYTGCHMVVFVHGFQGSSTDMKVLKNYFSLLHPEAVFLLSDANHNNTENCIEDMGEKLAAEISKKIESYWPDTLGRLSFIGHSMGGIIIRAALPYLIKYQEKMFTYMSLSTPHLGYMYNASKIISTGMWIMKQWKKSKSLTQLSMTDSKNLEDTFLYKLSCWDGLNWFKNIVLISSYKDSYAPFDSARIQSWTQATQDMKNGEFYIKMANNILEKMSADSIHRIDVNFMISEKTIDTFIGRAAHIHFLENQYFMRILSHRFVEFFD